MIWIFKSFPYRLNDYIVQKMFLKLTLSIFMSKLTFSRHQFLKLECFLLNHLSETSQWKIIESRKPKEYIKEAKIAFVQSCIPHDVS